MAAQREWFDKDYYKTLGVTKSATDKEITKAYRKLAKEFHPDANPGNKKAEDRFKEVSSAYDVLGDTSKRREYDEVRSMAGAGGGGSMGYGGGGFGPRGNPYAQHSGSGSTGDTNFSFDDLGDLFGGLFNRQDRARGAMARRGDDVESRLRMTFDQSVAGITTAVTTSTGSTIKARIPAGVHDGQTIRLRGKGGPGMNGGEAGDLFIHVEVQPHAMFGRSGNDLTLDVPVTYTELVLGTQVRVPTLTEPVTVKVPAGSQPGRVLRVRGRGVATAKSAGDLMVTVQLAVPKALSDKERKAVENLAKIEDGAAVRAKLGVQ